MSAAPVQGRRVAAATVKAHWPVYAQEALEVALLMASSSLVGIALFHPASPAVQGIESALARRALTGIAMGLTVLGLIHSPMGQRSGAHMNPAITLTYWRLGMIESVDAAFYVLAQFAGAVLGMLAMSAFLGDALAHAAVRFVTTAPGPSGAAAAWIGEFLIALVLMLTVLVVSNCKPLAPFTGLAAALLVAAFILVESPVSGASMNPARTFGSSLAAGHWTGLWIYFTAPPLAMLAASELYLRTPRGPQVYCAKLNHFNDKRCIFPCRFHDMLEEQAAAPAAHAEVS